LEIAVECGRKPGADPLVSGQARPVVPPGRTQTAIGAEIEGVRRIGSSREIRQRWRRRAGWDGSNANGKSRQSAERGIDFGKVGRGYDVAERIVRLRCGLDDPAVRFQQYAGIARAQAEIDPIAAAYAGRLQF